MGGEKLRAALAVEVRKALRCFKGSSQPYNARRGEMMSFAKPSGPFGSQSVESTPELERIKALPRRVWTGEAALQLARDMTKELKTPGGTLELRPVQAITLYEAMQCGGAFCPTKGRRGQELVMLSATTCAGGEASGVVPSGLSY